MAKTAAFTFVLCFALAGCIATGGSGSGYNRPEAPNSGQRNAGAEDNQVGLERYPGQGAHPDPATRPQPRR